MSSRATTWSVAGGTFAILAGGAWIAWQVLQGDRDTLTHSEFQTWLMLVVAAAGVVLIGLAMARRNRPAWNGLALGLVLAAITIVAGIAIDVLTSAS